MADVILEYKREGRDLSTGHIFVLEDGDETCWLAFERFGFSAMMVQFSMALIENPEFGGVMRRSDSPTLKPYRLDQKTVDQLRVDPIAVVRSMTFEQQTVVSKRKEIVQPSSHIVVGYDVFATTFGEEAYCRMRADLIECPVCGRWALVKDGMMGCVSRTCLARLPVTLRGDRWGGIPVPSLLALDVERFFLPRTWNAKPPWVSKDDLAARYDNWINIKESIV